MQHKSAFLKKVKPLCKNAPAFGKRVFYGILQYVAALTKK